jgi:hypothetical protein
VAELRPSSPPTSLGCITGVTGRIRMAARVADLVGCAAKTGEAGGRAD